MCSLATSSSETLGPNEGGTLQQRITSCLEVLDGFMKQDNPIVSSMVVAEKRAGGGVAGNIVDTVINILGLRDLKTVSLHSTLAELGMDSMMAVEIKQTLEREFEVFLTPQDIRGMTFAKLQEIAAATETNAAKSKESVTAATEALPDFGINHLLRVIGDEMTAGEPVVKLPSLHEGGEIEDITNSENLFFLIPGIEGVASVLEPLAVHLKAQALCLQFDYEVPHTTIGDLAASLIPHIKKRLPPGAPFNLVGYSFGGCVAVDIVHKLEMEGRYCHLWLIDSAPDFLRSLAAKSLDANMSDDLLQVNIILRFVDMVWNQDTTQLEVQLKELPNWQSRVDFLVTNSPEGKYSKRYQKQIMNAIYYRVSAVLNYEGLPEKCLNSQVTLIRPSEISMASEEDYGLSKYFKDPVKIHFVEGNHITILENKKTADLINNRAASEVVEFKKSLMELPSGALTSLET